MSVSPSAPTEDTTGRRYVPIRCIVEYVESSVDNGAKGMHCRREQDSVVRIPGHCPFDEIVIVALQKLGYTTRDITGAKGALQFPNWNSLSCDSITDNLEATVESILGGVASLVTLRIRLHGRPKSSSREDVKEKLLSFLVQKLQPVLKNSGCPINQTILDEISNGDLIDLLPSTTQQAFDRWFRDQLERPAALPGNDEQTNSGPPTLGNSRVNGLDGNNRETLDSPGQRNGRSETQPPWTSDHPRIRLKDEPIEEEEEEEEDPKNDGKDFRWNGVDSKLKGVPDDREDSFKKVLLSHRMRLLPNRNAVYEADALLPVSPEQPETEVLVVTPEMPSGEVELEEPSAIQPSFPGGVSSSSSFQNEPTDLSVRRRNGNELAVAFSGAEPPPTMTMTTTAQSLMLRPFRALTGQMGAEYSTNKDSRSPSPFLPPPFMHTAAAAAVQNHLVHFQQQQQQAIQLAAMSRAFNFHFGPAAGVHPLKGLTRSDLERPVFPYKTSGGGGSLPGSAASPQATSLTHLGLSDPHKASAAAAAAAAAANARDQKKRSRVFIDPLTEIPKLERWFAEDTHPSSYVIEKFTDELNRSPYRQRFPKLEPKNLQLWFKNHRAKMKRHRELVPSQQQQQQHPPTAGPPGFDATSPSSFYSDWAADRSCSTPGLKLATSHVTMTTTSSCSPSSSAGSRVASSPAPETKSASDCSEDEDMDVCPEERRELDD